MPLRSQVFSQRGSWACRTTQGPRELPYFCYQKSGQTCTDMCTLYIEGTQTHDGSKNPKHSDHITTMLFTHSVMARLTTISALRTTVPFSLGVVFGPQKVPISIT
jgi:hypothetical protein